MQEFIDFVAKPKIAWFTLNRNCNFRCPWCYAQCASTTDDPIMELELCKKLIRIASDLGISRIVMIGGEPTLYPYLTEINAICKALHISTTIITNAYRFADDAYWELYQTSPCDDVEISVKTVNSSAFRKIGNGLSLEKGLTGIKRAIDYYHTGITTVLNKEVGIDGLTEIAKFADGINAEYLSISPCSAYLTDNGFDMGSSYDLKQLAETVRSIYPILENVYNGKLHFSMRIPLCVFPVDFVEKMQKNGDIPFSCHLYERSGVVFDTNGDVLLCNDLYEDPLAKYGVDYMSANQLLSILNSDEMKNDFRQLLRYPSKECDKCSWNNICTGGCLMTWLANDPSICHAIVQESL